MEATAKRAAFRALHEGTHLFLLPNPWDIGSAKLLEQLGFEALATTSSGFAQTLGRLDQTVSRGELVEHVRALAAAVSIPLNVDSEQCYPREDGGIARTVELLADAGAAGFSLEDYDPVDDAILGLDVAVERVAAAVAANRALPEPMVVTARAENHLHGKDDLDDTIARLVAYRDAGADCVFAPGLRDLGEIGRLVSAVGVPVNVLAWPGGPVAEELEGVGVRRISTGSWLARDAYGYLVRSATALRDTGALAFEGGIESNLLRAALG